jgi:hypothetical protein
MIVTFSICESNTAIEENAYPLPIPDPPLALASTCESETKRTPICPAVEVPIPEPSDKLFAKTVEFTIARLPIRDRHSPGPDSRTGPGGAQSSDTDPVPIPEPGK